MPRTDHAGIGRDGGEGIKAERRCETIRQMTEEELKGVPLKELERLPEVLAYETVGNHNQVTLQAKLAKEHPNLMMILDVIEYLRRDGVVQDNLEESK